MCKKLELKPNTILQLTHNLLDLVCKFNSNYFQILFGLIKNNQKKNNNSVKIIYKLILHVIQVILVQSQLVVS